MECGLLEKNKFLLWLVRRGLCSMQTLLITNQKSIYSADTIDFTRDEVTMLADKLSLATTASGYYCISIYPKIIHDNLPKVKPHWMSLILLEISSMLTKSQKLHIQFTCTSKVDYWNLLLILENICEESEVYEKMASLKPVVGLALAKLFNQVRSAWISKITYKTKHGFWIWLIQEGCTLQYI